MGASARDVSLTFNEQAHQYFWGGRPVVNVTRVLSPLIDLSRIPADALENARQEGKAIHLMAELECKGDLNEANLPEWLAPYLLAWRKFIADSGFELWASERRLYSKRYAYAGTPDLVGIPHKFKDAKPCVVDLKRSFASGAAINLQLAAYAEAWNLEHATDRNLIVRRRYGLRLMKDGNYRCLPFEDKTDFTDFLTCLAFWRIKERFNG